MRTAISIIMTAQAAERLSILQNHLNDLTTTYLNSKSEIGHLRGRLEAVFGHSNLERGERAALYTGVKHYQDLMALDLAIMRGVHAQMEEIHANEKKKNCGGAGEDAKNNDGKGTEVKGEDEDERA